MGLSRALDISTSGIMAERQHMELIASNIANINSTKTVDGTAYKRKMQVYHEKPLVFSDELDKASNRLEKSAGVEFKVVEDNSSKLQRIYNPSHPDADKDGFVTMPNVSLATEMTDLVYAGKLYEANITVFNATKKMNTDILQLQ